MDCDSEGTAKSNGFQGTSTIHQIVYVHGGRIGGAACLVGRSERQKIGAIWAVEIELSLAGMSYLV